VAPLIFLAIFLFLCLNTFNMTYTLSQIQKDPNKIVNALMNLKQGILIKKQRKPYSVTLRYNDLQNLMEKFEDLEAAVRFERAYRKTRDEKDITLEELKKENNLK